jgi:hypothetical protein
MRVIVAPGRRRVAAFGLLLVGIALMPVQTRQGVNYQVTSRRVPLYEKALGFALRDAEYRRVAREITRGLSGEEARAMALFEWTRTHIRPTPSGWPVVDDHILHIMIRGYGEPDQQADVFTTLAAYRGLPAFWKIIRADEGAGKLVLSFVKIEGHWTTWDVHQGVVFRNAAGALAAVEELAHQPELVRPHEPYVAQALARFSVPEILRARQQMPIPRLWFELTCAWRRC